MPPADSPLAHEHFCNYSAALILFLGPCSISVFADTAIDSGGICFILSSSEKSFKLAGDTGGRRSSQGGFLHRVFGTSPSNRDRDPDSSVAVTDAGSANDSNTPVKSEGKGSPSGDSRNSTSSRKGSDSAGSNSTDGKKRRSSAAKAAALFSSAKNSLHFPGHNERGETPAFLTPMQKLGKTDPALTVPQGSNNNSAGESSPTPHSSFLVGVTEDKNKKCRRTMEDTHAYLYNFLGTPAPSYVSESKSEGSDASTADVSDTSKHVVETDNGYFAIFDGHAGTFAAEWCGKKLHVILEEMMRKNPNTPVPELLDQTFTSVDQQLEKLPLKNSGCTAITAVLRWEDRVPNSQSATGSTSIAQATAAVVKATETGETPATIPDPAPKTDGSPDSTAKAIQKVQDAASRQRVLYTANVGDARIVLCRNGKALRLSYDHKGSDENEGKRIANAGGLILNNRVNGVLAVTRALGDSYLKDLVTGHPYTTETVIQPDIDEFLILACDGLWDVCSDQEAVDLIRNVKDPQAASKLLVDHALARFSTDNLSVMIIRFDSKTLQSNATTTIGLDTDPAAKAKGAVTEVEMIVDEAKRNSGVGEPVASSDRPSDDLKHDIIKELNEDQEPGPELTQEGMEAATDNTISQESKASTTGEESKEA